MKKKLLYLTSILLFATASINAQDVVRSWVFPSPVPVAAPGTPFVSPGIAFPYIDVPAVVDGLTIVPGTAAVLTFGVTAASNVVFVADNTAFTGNFKFGGGSIAPALATQADYLSTTANFMPNQRYLSFPVAAGSTKVKVWFKTASGGALRSLICSNGINWKTSVTTITAPVGGSLTQAQADQAILDATYTAAAAGTLYLWSDFGTNLYKIEVTGPAPALAVNSFQKETPIVVSARNGKINFSNVKSSTKVSVYNVLGSLVKSIQADADTSLDINNGVYIVKTKSVNGEKSVKVMVQ